MAKTSHGLGVVTSTSYKLGYTDGTNADGDMKAIELAAKQKEGDKAKSDPQRKLLVGKALGIKRSSNSCLQKRQFQTAVDRIPQVDCQIGNLAVGGGGGLLWAGGGAVAAKQPEVEKNNLFRFFS